MKKLLLLSFITALFISTIAKAENSIFFVSGGKSSEPESATARIGVIGENFGASLGYLIKSGYPSGDIFDYPCPHNYYRNLGTFDDSKIGVDVYAAYNPVPWDTIALGGGLYFYERAEISQSRASGKYYKESKRTELKPAVSIDNFFVINEKVVLGVGYHTILGFQVSLGLAF